MEKTSKLKKVDEKISRRILVKTIILCLVVLCLGCFSVFMFTKGVKATKEYNYSYSNNNNIDYKVYLKENDYFEDDYLGKEGNYIASLIDKITADFEYKLDSNKNLRGSYTYYVTATLEAKEKGKDIVIWSKEEEIFKKQTNKVVDSTGFDISPNVSIKYDKYNSVMNEFRNAYGVPLDANLVITMHIDSNLRVLNQDKSIKDSQESSLYIPLLEQTVQMKEEFPKSKYITKHISYKKRTIWHYILCIIGIILFACFLYFSTKLFSKLISFYFNRNKYELRLKKLLNNYSSVIVKVNELPKTSSKQTLDLDNFDDLLDAQAESREPILYKEKENESIFIVIKDDCLFKYILKETDFK